MVLATSTFDILSQLNNLLEQLDENEFCKSLDSIDGNSVGKHVRHIIEFYQEMLKGFETGMIDYDARERNLKLETDKKYVETTINCILQEIFKIKEDKTIKLKVNLGLVDSECMIDTTIFREIAYNIEHTIHHFAIIKLAIDANFENVYVPANFGIAYSTIKHQQSVCVQ